MSIYISIDDNTLSNPIIIVDNFKAELDSIDSYFEDLLSQHLSIDKLIEEFKNNPILILSCDSPFEDVNEEKIDELVDILAEYFIEPITGKMQILNKGLENKDDASSKQIASTHLDKLARIHLSGFEQLPLETIILFLTNQKFINLIDDASLERILLAQANLSAIISKNNHLARRVNELNPHMHKQTFEASCAARSILLMLHELGLLRADECTASKEYEIYSQIWSEPGGTADPEKLINYLTSHNLKVVGAVANDVEAKIKSKDVSRVDPFLNFLEESRKQSSLATFSFIQKLRDEAKVPIKKVSTLDDLKLADNEVALVAVNTLQHIVFVKQLAEGKLEVIDPAKGIPDYYGNYHDFVEKNEALGVQLEIRQFIK